MMLSPFTFQRNQRLLLPNSSIWGHGGMELCRTQELCGNNPQSSTGDTTSAGALQSREVFP